RHNISVNTGASVVSHDAHAVDLDSSTPLSATLQRRTSVSNPCLLHHTNTNGSGTVRPPIMPRSMSSPHTDHSPADHENQALNKDRLESDHGRTLSSVHEPTIAENPQAYF
ncbi:hypothetical protein BGZ96_012514, partial [Linnemannia gamsii]